MLGFSFSITIFTVFFLKKKNWELVNLKAFIAYFTTGHLFRILT